MELGNDVDGCSLDFITISLLEDIVAEFRA